MVKIKFILFFIFSVALFADKVEITSDAMQAEEMKKEVHFIGNVKITQLKSWIHGDRMIVYFDDNNQTKRYEAIGRVTFEFKKDNHFYKGSANRVIYAPLDSQYILRGNAKIEDMINKRHINGEHIKLDLTSGLASVIGNKQDPVKFIFETEDTK
ncbi:lipopolysaccharide transport periplasmic protein LptA [Sulfurovum sp. zt1-1]|uniref:Lipopolysaccharide transport periplasmic protein LptA n=1 Tax=Sulfurovum zhangzhouensis TaxID=3019067 RepID=A0ABT7QUU8_9BACT|nr:lipopolysaccharide transport periplasmic protein LptA [Sulfurovum zhangzhouensis]MDM5270618.1 lipopolysaccharide transport periplasmic protein LptA [Sulfurovum zhangzhouensis]